MYGCIRATVLAFNIIFLLCGMGILGIGVWIRVDMLQFDALLGSSMVPLAAYVLIGAGGVVMLISLAGCVGALKENRSLLTLYFVFLLLIFLMEAAAAVLGALFYDQVKPFMAKYVETAMMDNYGNPSFKLVTESIDILQQKFQCCGFNSPSDWANATYFTNVTDPSVKVPISCCIDKNEPSCNNQYGGNTVYADGCLQSLVDWMSGNLVYLLGVAIGVAVFQLVAMVFSICLCKQAGYSDVA